MTYASEQSVLNGQWNAAEMAFQAECKRKTPTVLMRPALIADGDMWCLLYGEDLQSGVAGFGETPEQAAINFDIAWLNGRTPAAMFKASKAKKCAYCETTEGLRVKCKGHGSVAPEYTCEACFTGTDSGPSSDDLPEVEAMTPKKDDYMRGYGDGWKDAVNAHLAVAVRIAEGAYEDAPSGSFDNGGTQDGWQMACQEIAKRIAAQVPA